MIKKENSSQGIKKGIIRTVLWTAVGLLIVLALLISAIQIPYVQTRIVEKLSTTVSNKIGFPVSIGYVNIRWFDKLLIEDLLIKDPKNNEMIAVKEMLVDFQLYDLLNQENINIDEVVLTNADVKLIKNTPTEGLNISLFINNLRDWLAPDKPSTKKKPLFTIDNILLETSSFSMNDPTKDSIPDRFDYYHFSLTPVDLRATDFLVVADTLQFNLEALATRDAKTGLAVHEMSTFYRLSKSAMQFFDLHLKANESVIRDSVIFHYDNTSALSYFKDSVTIEANLDSTIIYSKDLALFAPYLNKYEEHYTLSGKVEGMVNNISIENMRLTFGNNSSLQGGLSFDGLPNFQETFIEGDLKNSHVSPEDVEKYVNADIYRQIKKLGNVYLSANFIGFPYDFVAKGTFNTEIGKVVSDINLKIDEGTQRSFYSGSLATFNFNLGKIVDRPELVQNINMKGNISGSGFRLENANFNLKATIDQLGFKGYIYKNIVTDAKMAKEFFQGELSINDPNLKFKASGNIDLRNNINKINVAAALDTALLKPLKLSGKDIVISTILDLNINGLELDSITGYGNFSETFLYYEGRQLELDSLKVLSLRNDAGRTFNMSSDFADIRADGYFEFTELYNDIKRLVKEYKLNFLNNDQTIKAYYASKDQNYKRNDRRSELDFRIKLKDINLITNLFLPDLYVSENTKFEGSFSGGYTSILALNGFVDTLNYNNIRLFDTEIDLNTSKVADSTNVLAMAYVYSPHQKIKGLTDTKDLLFEGVWLNDHIDFRSNLLIEEDQSFIKLFGDLEFLTNKTRITFNNSQLFAVGKGWNINPDNKIIIADREIHFDNLKFFHDEQNITINGAISDSLDKKLTVEINSFDISNLNPLLNYKLAGEINGYVEAQNLYQEFLMESEMAISDFQIEQFLVGHLSGISKWDAFDKKLNIDYQINRLSKKIMALKGYVQPQNEENQLNIQARFDEANINIAEPFIDEIFSEIKGVASGEFQISGNIDYPILTGEGAIKDGGFRLNYLNTRYTFGGEMVFDANEIGVRDFNLLDENFNKAILNGGVFHDGFKDFVIDLSADMNSFQVLNTSRNDNNLYYGTAYVTGRLDILGAVSNLNFDATAKTEKGTRLYIPIEGTSGVQQEAFIHFVDFNDSLRSVDLENLDNKINLTGLNLDFDIDITPDAYTEIIFDLQAGDIIRGRGNGKINLLIDTNGDFNMFGDYEFVNGGYNFTLYNIINKEFDIHSGSTINWYGNPYEGILDIDASYQQMASLVPLLNVSEDIELNAELKRRYPAEVLLELKGPLLSPEIDFDINVSNYPENATTPNGISLGNAVDLFINRINLDKQERERQVFSLIVLRQFSPENSFNTSGSFGSSVSELFSNQLSYWITQVDENLEIDVDLSGLDAEAFNAFQLRLSYSFFDGRLRVTRDGSFTNVENETSPLSVLGEWTVEYFLTKDGKFRAKVYNRNNYNWYDQNNPEEDRQTSFSGGISLLHVTSFDNLKELFTDFKKEQREKEKDERELQQEEEKEEEKEKEPIPPLNVANPTKEE